jgi:cytochrome c oxidase assembly factor CtaG
MLITFAPTTWYLPEEPAILGFTGLEDQQLGGLIMWVPGGLVYVAAGLAVLAGRLTRPAGRSRSAPREVAAK